MKIYNATIENSCYYDKQIGISQFPSKNVCQWMPFASLCLGVIPLTTFQHGNADSCP